MRNRFPLIVLILSALLLPLKSKATHLRAGEITAERLSCSSLAFRFTITVFIDTESGVKFGGSNDWLDFGDGTRLLVKEQSTIPRPDLGSNMGIVIYQVTHEYSGAASEYTITYSEENRNANVV